jgi:PAS domain S-box-containing protein
MGGTEEVAMSLTQNPRPAHPRNAGQLAAAVRPAPTGIRPPQKKANPALQQTDQDLRQASRDFQLPGQAVADIQTRYQLLVNSVTDYALYMLDQEGRVVTWNAGAERLKGYTAEEILGRNYSLFFLPEDVEAGVPARELAEAAREGRYEVEAWRLRKDGTKFWAMITLTAIRGPREELRGFAKVTRDMTARKTAEEALRIHVAELERYRAVIDNVDEYGIVTLDPEGRITGWNHGGERNTGYSTAEILGREYGSIATEEDRQAGLPQQELEEAARTGRCVRDSWKLRKDGSRLWAAGVMTAIRDETGKLTGFIRIGRDMTRQKLAEESLKRLNAQLERYRIIVDNIDGYVIFTLDAEGRINSWSPGAQNVLGYKAHEVIGREYSMVFTPEEIVAGMPRQEMEEAKRNGSCATENWRVCRDGSQIWASGVLSEFRDEMGELTGYIRVGHDMTQHKQLQDAQARLAVELEDRVQERTMQLDANMEELRRKNAEVEASAQVLNRELQEKVVLFHEIHHRVKNNLQVVQSLLKMQVRALPASDARAAIEATILRVRSMATVHERLYEMPSLADLPVAEFLRDIFNGVIASYSVRSGRIKFHLDAEEIRLDLEKAVPFGLLANELLSNSLKHAFPAGKKGTISVSVHRAGDAVRMIIQDNGIGLPVNFDAGSSNSMGLKLAQSLAHQLGGTLQFTSRRGCRADAVFTRL